MTAEREKERPFLDEPGRSFEENLIKQVRSGRKFLAIYLTAGLPEPARFQELVERVCEAGADVVEIGIPFSDPVMDGPVIQKASKWALDRGITPGWAIEAASSLDVGAGLVAMTYYNLALRFGLSAFAKALAEAGVGGAILADLPIDESAGWQEAAVSAGVAPVMLAAPNASDRRLLQICAASRGFVYGISLLGVTGARQSLSQLAKQLGDRLRGLTDLPVGIGIGISSASQAGEVAPHCDGIIVGSAVIDRVMSASDPDRAIDAACALVAELRAGLDS